MSTDNTPAFDYTLVVPTYRRQDVLQQCLEHLVALDKLGKRIEVRVYDNGSPQDSRAVAEPFIEKFTNGCALTYTLNDPGHGLGYSLCRGVDESRGAIIIELNDDALLPPDFLERLDPLFSEQADIGVVGVRAIEDGYGRQDGTPGRIDRHSVDVIGNFDMPTEAPIDVEHVYGFCYAYRRELIDRGAGHDRVLLARDYSSGNRIETDQCLTARRLGYRVVYDGRIAVTHLAKPRADMSEVSMRWRRNHVRNTLYLYLKHFGLAGRGWIALRFSLRDLGLRSAVLRPSKYNLAYCWTGVSARLSALAHWMKHLCCGRKLQPRV